MMRVVCQLKYGSTLAMMFLVCQHSMAILYILLNATAVYKWPRVFCIPRVLTLLHRQREHFAYILLRVPCIFPSV
jgi:hypothetical protein